VGFFLAFRGAAQMGFGAFMSPTYWVLMLFWPIAVWQWAWGQFGG
jgi:hypothetical protein